MTQVPGVAPRRRRLAISLATALALAAMLALVVAPANAAQDPVKSGTFKLKLAKSFKKQLKSNGVKMKPKKFAITGGSIDPTVGTYSSASSGTGNVTLKGKLKFKKGGKKYVVKKLKATVGTGGKLKGKAKGKKVTVAKLKGGTVTRNGFGAIISGIKAKFTKSAAKKINKALDLSSLHKGKMGTATIDEQPVTTAVVSGKADLSANPVLLQKLGSRGVDPATGGVTVISPATVNPATFTFSFPNLSGFVAPDGSSGQVTGQGGAKITKTNDTFTSAQCDTAHPVGVFIQLESPQVDYQAKTVSAIVTVPDATTGAPTNIGRAVIADYVPSSFTADPNTRTFSSSGTANITATNAATLNLIFGTAAEGCDPGGTGDFAAGDPLGTVNVSGATQ